jgi:integrase
VNGQTYVEPSKQTIAEYLTDWLVAIESRVRPATHYSYARNVRLHIVPRLGSVRLQRLDAGMLNRLYAALLADGNRSHDDRGLSPRTVRYVHTILHRALKDAVKWGRLARNPADAADPPRRSATARPKMTTWSAAEVRTFLDHVNDHRLSAAFLVLATTGMRRGEALGLRWSDLDLDAARPSIVLTVVAVNHQVLAVGSGRR